VDGRSHDVVVRLPRRAADTLVVRPLGLALAVERANAVPARVVGGRTGAVNLPGARPGRRGAMTQGAHGAWFPADTTARLRVALPRAPAGLAEVRLSLRAFKPVDARCGRS